MCHKYFILLAALLVPCLDNGSAQQMAIIEVKLESLLQMQQGFGWPLNLNVIEGNEALMRLSRQLENQQSCEVTTPAGLTFDVNTPPDNRYEKWSEGCGIRVRHVAPADTGRWRLTAMKGNDSLTGWSELHVLANITSYTPEAISLKDGQTKTQVELSTLNNSYCLVAQPFSESALVPGQCRITLDRTTRAVQGKWTVLLGIPGRVEELHVERNVAVEAERLDVGYVRDEANNKLNLYCNILHTAKNITFCRFQKTTETSGFNVMDGLSDGRYSYYGDGFLKRHCGMTIESVTANDYGTWRCTVGVQEWVGKTIEQKTPMQALINVLHTGKKKIRQKNLKTNVEVRTVFVQKGSNVTIACRADMSLAYCWFRHPNGSQFAPVERQAEGEEFWYTGESLQVGDCGIVFAHVTEEDSGIWTCHMGSKYEIGVEVMEEVLVRVTGPLAATKKKVDVIIGGAATLYCHTSNGPRPLDYCRFVAPNFVGFSMDSSVTAENAILGRFYFTPERNLDYGDCSLTINPVTEEDIGEWTCAALVHDETVESRDTMDVNIASGRPMRFRAGIAGMSVGIAVLAGVLVGTVWYKKGMPIPWRRRLSNNTDDLSLRNLSSESRNSVNSSSTNSSGSRTSA